MYLKPPFGSHKGCGYEIYTAIKVNYIEAKKQNKKISIELMVLLLLVFKTLIVLFPLKLFL